MNQHLFNKRSSNLCVIGSANTDLIFRAPRFPAPGETLTGRSFQQCLGGKGANQAVAAARLDSQLTFIACVGNDSFGSTAIRQFRDEGINTEFIRPVDDQPTGTAVILVDDQAENCIVVVPGANHELGSDDVGRASAAIAQADITVAQLETPVDATLAAFRVARAAGKRTVLTPAPMIELPNELLELCDVCVPNRTEIEMLVGRSVRSTEDAHRAALALLDKGVQSVVITMGSDGCYVADRSSAVHLPAYQVVAVDTTGAGDAFSAALSVFLSEGQPLLQAAERASYVAAISVTRHGTQPSFPTRAEVDRPLALSEYE